MDEKEDFLHILLQRLKTSSEAIETEPIHLCSNLVESLSRNQAALVGEVVATLCSEESFREQARENGVLSALLPFLSSADLHTRLQVLRAIGNLCIDNDSNREAVLAAGGCQTLIQLVKKCSDSSNEECSSERYKSVVCGCVLNLVVDNERLAQEFLHHGALEEIASLLSTLNQSETVVKYGLEVLCLLVEAGLANQENKVSKEFLKTLLNLLECDFVDLALNFIKTLVEKDNENISLQLVEVGICKILLQIEHQQQAMDILVLLLGQDKCVEVIIDAGEVLNVARSWLERTESSTQLQKANAALIIANMARSDSNCTSLVKSGIVPLIIALVKLEETESMKGKLHHAALSALRNLSLPNDHKEMFFSMGVVDCAIYALKTSTLSHEQFKAIGILRLLVEKQAHTCSYVILEAMECLNRVCEESGIPHVHIESGRLLSAVVKYCQDENVLTKIFEEGGLKWMYNLMKSEQPQLIAEGLIAINILAVIMKEEALAIFVKEASSTIVDCLCSVLTSSFPLNLINNSLLLIKTLLSTKSDLADVLKSSMEVKQVVQKLTSHENEEIQLRAKEILELL